MENVNTFVYYGALIEKHDYENMIEKLGYQNFYSEVFSRKLMFRDVGKLGKSWKYVVGKELTYTREDVNSFKDLEVLNVSVDEKLDIRSKLLEVGITNLPEFHIFTSWS